MSKIHDLLDGLRDDPTCVFASPAEKAGPPPFAWPDDLQHFYEVCGGLAMFVNAPFVWEVVGPHGLTPTNLEVIGEQVDDDITSSWFVIARQRGDSNALISIDSRADRLGWCYDSDVEVHGLVGNCAILAFSFTELLGELISARGEYVFWEGEQFVHKGDAYDAIDSSSIYRR